MPKILELKQRRKDLSKEMRALADRTDLDAAGVARFAEIRAEGQRLVEAIERIEIVEREEAALGRLDDAPRPQPEGGAGGARRPRIETFGITNLGELLFLSVFKKNDDRLVALQEAQTGTGGGFGIPDQFDPLLRAVTPQEAIWRPRATVVPAGEAPDAEFTLPSLNQQSGSNMYGGVAVDWIGEGIAKPDTTAKIKEVKWTPKEVAASLVVTEKLLRNWSAASSTIDTLVRGALLAAEDVAFMKGNGVARPEGVLSSPCLKKVNRATINTVKYVDLCKMEAELLLDGQPVWIVSRRVLPVLRQMEDTAGNLVWAESARDGMPPTLLGYPVVTNVRSPALGSLGDVVLAVPTYYIIKDGAPLTIAGSEHVKFLENKIVIKCFRSVDGHPWLDGPIADEDGSTYSPFVALDVPA